MYPLSLPSLSKLGIEMMLPLYTLSTCFSAFRIRQILLPHLRELLNSDTAPVLYAAASHAGDLVLASDAASCLLHPDLDWAALPADLPVEARLNLINLHHLRLRHVIGFTSDLFALGQGTHRPCHNCANSSTDFFVALGSWVIRLAKPGITAEIFFASLLPNNPPNYCDTCKEFLHLILDGVNNGLKAMPQCI
ncbi:hypothetical protein K439DRAFT_1618512 [Ramaria rubella]|nr:hypothetical protein K439DRAFT_1618512 [Ramaria rubella]